MIHNHHHHHHICRKYLSKLPEKTNGSQNEWMNEWKNDLSMANKQTNIEKKDCFDSNKTEKTKFGKHCLLNWDWPERKKKCCRICRWPLRPSLLLAVDVFFFVFCAIQMGFCNHCSYIINKHCICRGNKISTSIFFFAICSIKDRGHGMNGISFLGLSSLYIYYKNRIQHNHPIWLMIQDGDNHHHHNSFVYNVQPLLQQRIFDFDTKKKKNFSVQRISIFGNFRKWWFWSDDEIVMI